MNLEPLIDEIVNRLAGRIATADDLVELPGPLAENTARRLVKSGTLPAVKLGKKTYTLRRHLTALVPEPKAVVADFDARAFLRDAAAKKSA